MPSKTIDFDDQTSRAAEEDHIFLLKALSGSSKYELSSLIDLSTNNEKKEHSV